MPAIRILVLYSKTGKMFMTPLMPILLIAPQPKLGSEGYNDLD
jgi:hypothetical protein